MGSWRHREGERNVRERCEEERCRIIKREIVYYEGD